MPRADRKLTFAEKLQHDPHAWRLWVYGELTDWKCRWANRRPRPRPRQRLDENPLAVPEGMRFCSFCGELFKARTKTQRYCPRPAKCYQRAKSRRKWKRGKHWNQVNPDKARVSRKSWYERKKQNKRVRMRL